MIMLKKAKVVFVISIILSFLILPFKVSGENDYQLIIDDEQDLLSENEENLLRNKMSEILEYGNVAFVTVAQYDDTGSYAKQLYRQLFGTDSGFLFLIDMGRRNIWIHSNGAIYRVIDKSYANTITDNIYRYASKEEYYNCAYNAYDQALTLLKGGMISQPMKYISNALIALVSALLLNFMVLVIQKGYLHPKVKEYTAKALTTAVGVKVLEKTLLKRKKSKHIESSGGSSGGHSYSGGGGGSSGGGGGGGGGHSF